VVLAVNAVAREHDAVAAVLLFALFAMPAVYYARAAVSAKPVLVIDGDGIVVTRPARRLRWDDIETIAIEERTAVFGVEQESLVLHLAAHRVEPAERHLPGLVTRAHDPLVIQLYHLSPSRPQIARAIREQSGRRPAVPTKYGPAGP
jgi:hypothetical protein